MNRLKRLFLSPIVLLTASSLAAIAYVLSSEAFERSLYALNYSASQIEQGFWTEAQSRVMVGHTLLDAALSLSAPLLSIVCITILLLVLQRRIRSSCLKN